MLRLRSQTTWLAANLATLRRQEPDFRSRMVNKRLFSSSHLVSLWSFVVVLFSSVFMLFLVYSYYCKYISLVLARITESINNAQTTMSSLLGFKDDGTK
jgi:hypothetical protein